MSKIQELEKQLREEKAKEKEHSRKKDFLRLKVLYNNTAWASHKLASTKRSAKGIRFEMVKLSNFRAEEDPYDNKAVYYMDKTTISYISSNDGNHTYNRTTYRTKTESYFGGYTGDVIRKENSISVENFDAAYKLGEAASDLFYEKIREGLRTTEYITVGDHNHKTNEVKLLVDSGLPLINLKEFPDRGGSNLTIFELLSYNSHPLVVGDYLVNCTKSKEIILTIAKNMYSNASSWGSSIAERDFPRVDVLKSFVEKVTWEA